MLTTIIAIALLTIFLFLSGIHVYWGLGGKWGSGAVIPVKDDHTEVFMPGILPTFIVAAGLLGFGLLALDKAFTLYGKLPDWLEFVRRHGLWLIVFIFMLRAIGEFNYVGFFKKIKHTKFAQNDTRYYTPLCLIISILALILQVSQ